MTEHKWKMIVYNLLVEEGHIVSLFQCENCKTITAETYDYLMEHKGECPT